MNEGTDMSVESGDTSSVGEGLKVELTEADREELIIKYRLKARKLSRSILRKWHARLELEDVDSVVDLSLCEAARRYDPSYGASFMTFLYFHLRGNLIRTVSEAVTGNGIVTEDDEDSMRAHAAALGSNAPRGTAKVAYASDVADVMYNAPEELTPESTIHRKQLARISQEACEKLDPLEREVIVRIFLKEQQLLDIAESLGYSRCHISRVKKRALEALYGHLLGPVGDEFSSAGSEGDEEEIKPARRSVRRRRKHNFDSGEEVDWKNLSIP